MWKECHLCQVCNWVSSHLSSDDVPWQKLNSQTPERLTANEFVIGGRHQWTQSADSIRQLALRQHSAAMHRTHSKHHANTTLGKDVLPSVLWRCWLGSRKGIRPVKKLSVECWCGSVWSEVQTCIWPSWCHSLSLASVKSRLVLPFWYQLTWVVPEKGPLNARARVCGRVV